MQVSRTSPRTASLPQLSIPAPGSDAQCLVAQPKSLQRLPSDLQHDRRHHRLLHGQLARACWLARLAARLTRSLLVFSQAERLGRRFLFITSAAGMAVSFAAWTVSRAATSSLGFALTKPLSSSAPVFTPEVVTQRPGKPSSASSLSTTASTSVSLSPLFSLPAHRVLRCPGHRLHASRRRLPGRDSALQHSCEGIGRQLDCSDCCSSFQSVRQPRRSGSAQVEGRPDRVLSTCLAPADINHSFTCSTTSSTRSAHHFSFRVSACLPFQVQV